MQVVFAQLSAVIARSHLKQAGECHGCLEAGFHGRVNVRFGDTVNPPFVNGVGSGGKSLFGDSPQCRTIRIVGAGFHLFIPRTDLTAAPDNPTGEGENDVGKLPNCGDGRLGGL